MPETSQSKAVVRLKSVSHQFSANSHFALQDINLEFFKGEIIGITGPDGSGKTTLLRLIASALVPSCGEVLIDGLNTIQDQDHVVSCIGYMPQKFGLYEDLTVLENLHLFASLKSINPKTNKELIDSLLEFSSLKPFTQRLARNLSGGMKQKLGLACALLKKPKVLILDEPSVGVDPLSRRELWSKVVSLLDSDICILWSTSYLDEAEKCNKVVLLSSGKIQFFGKPQDLLQTIAPQVFSIPNAQNKRTLLNELIENPSVIEGVIEGSSIRLILEKGQSIEGALKSPARMEDAFINLIKKDAQKIPMFKFIKPSISKQEFPIQAHHLTKFFGSFVAVNDISLEVKKGEVFGLLGPNGAGKSTTFKMLSGLLAPNSGFALLDGKPSINSRSDIGYMAQKFSLYGNITLRQNLEFFSSIYCLDPIEQRGTVENALKILGLKPFENKIVDTLAVGIKQKLSFAACIMHSPKVLFLDEPTSGMDPITRRSFWRQINYLAISGCTIMITTHFMDEAENCDRFALIHDGKILFLGDSDTLKNEAKTLANPDPTLEEAFIYKMGGGR